MYYKFSTMEDNFGDFESTHDCYRLDPDDLVGYLWHLHTYASKLHIKIIEATIFLISSWVKLEYFFLVHSFKWYKNSKPRGRLASTHSNLRLSSRRSAQYSQGHRLKYGISVEMHLVHLKILVYLKLLICL